MGNAHTRCTRNTPISNAPARQAVFPLAAFALKRLLVAAAGDGAEKIPNGILAFGVEGVSKLAVVKLAK